MIAVIALALIAAVVMLAVTGRLGAIGRAENAGGTALGNRGKGWRADMWQTIMRMLGETPPTPSGVIEGVARSTAPATPAPASPRVPIDPDMPRLPGSAKPVLKTMQERLDTIEKRLEQADVLAQPVMIEVQQLRDVHLPKLLRSYVEIPDERKREIYARTQKSASVHLVEALGAMLDRLVEIDHGLSQENLDTFEDNMRFITRQYRGAGDPLA